MRLLFDRIESPIGTIVIVSDGTNLCVLEFGDYDERMKSLLRSRYGDFHFVETDDPQGFSSRMRDYLAGNLHSLDIIPVEAGGTPFQRRVWSELRKIPVGTTTSYGQLAATLGMPSASRAVGLANYLNPVAIVVPCHRVIGANGKLTGYAGGLHRKRWLLEHEGVCLPTDPDLPSALSPKQLKFNWA